MFNCDECGKRCVGVVMGYQGRILCAGCYAIVADSPVWGLVAGEPGAEVG